MTDYQVNFSELRSASSQLTAVQQQATNQLQVLSSVSLSMADFGRAPGQGSLYLNFVEHTEAGKESLQQVSEALGSASEGLAVTADIYEEVEQNAQQVVDQYFGSTN